MKPKLPQALSLLAVMALLAFTLHDQVTTGSERERKQRARRSIGCSPDWKQVNQWIEEVEIPPMPGSGTWKWTIKTNHDSAQFYFNQGINTYYGFHIIEAKASFRKALRFDSTSAMIQWAVALAEGPNINDIGYAASPDALLAVSKAVALSGNCTEIEKMLIDAQKVRYSEDTTISREELNQRYADKMAGIYEKYPDDPDIAALYADAMMLQHPWDLWYVNGTPRPWTPRIREVLEKMLKTHSTHPGANHYYIHVMEPSPFASLALPSADRLGELTPGLSHLVHMPSHIYLRTGNYQKGASVNEAAVNSYKSYIKLYEPVTGNDFLYIIHNLHMQTNHAMMIGDSAYAVRSAVETTNSIPAIYLQETGPLGNFLQYINMTPVLANVRFGNWDALMSIQKPEATQVYANVLYHFGRGMAMACRKQTIEAKQELQALQEWMKDSILAIPFTPFSPALSGATVAENLLAGSIALAEEKYIDAITALTKAVETEENMVYTEPRDWMLNPKHYLGHAYLEAGKYARAREVFLSDLKNNNENGWALYGMYKALEGEKKKAESQKMLARFKKAFAKSDISLKSSIVLQSPK